MSNAINPMERDGCWLCSGCGEIETELDNGNSVTVGCPVCVENDHRWYREKAEAERDAALAHVERLQNELENVAMGDDADRYTAADAYWSCADALAPHVHFGPPPMARGALSNSVVESLNFLLEFWIAAGKPSSLAAHDAALLREEADRLKELADADGRDTPHIRAGYAIVLNIRDRADAIERGESE